MEILKNEPLKNCERNTKSNDLLEKTSPEIHQKNLKYTASKQKTEVSIITIIQMGYCAMTEAKKSIQTP